jgi:colicin import membrane protein
LEYEAKNAERDRASLVFRRKEANIQRLEEEERRQAEYQVEQENRKLEDAARRDVEEYIKDCKDRRRLSLAFRAKEKRAHAEWERREAERRRAQQSRDTRDRAIDQRHVEAARQKERAKIALNAIRHAGCTFAVNPFAGLLDN